MKKSKILSVVLSSFFCFPATYSLNNITKTTFNPLFKAVEEEQITIPLSELATIDKAYDSPSFSKIKMSCSLDTENLTLSIDKIDSGDIEEDFLNLTFNDTYSYQGKQYSINEIGDNCFSSIQEKYGESLQTHLIGTINFSNSLSSVNNFSFYGLKNVDFAFYSLKYVKKIGNYAFADCDKLCSTYSNYLDLSSFNRLESIGDHAFYNDVNVYTLSLPSNTNSSLTHIYQSAFEGCTNLSGSIKLSGTISFLENDIFKNIKGFSEITFSWTEDQLKTLSFGNNFSFPTIDEQITVPKIYVPSGKKYFYKKFFIETKISTYDKYFDYFIGPDYILDISKILTDSISTHIDVEVSIIDHFSDALSVSIDKIDGKIENLIDLHFRDYITIDGEELNITYISDYAFYDQTNIFGKVTFPKNLIGIGQYAFASSKETFGMNLNSIDFSNSLNLKEIGSSAFENCPHLSGEIQLNSLIENIGENAFQNAGKFDDITLNWNSDQLENLKIGNSNSFPTLNIDGLIPPSVHIPINDYDNYLDFFEINKIDYALYLDYIETESFNIKDVLDIDTIDTSTQVICQFNQYTLTASIAKISNSQIIGNIKSLHKYVEHNGIQYKVTSIGDECFMNLSNLSGKLDIPNTINVIGDRAFKNTQIISLSTEQDSKLISIGNEAFADCSELSAIDLDDSLFLNSIGSNAFLNCVNLSGSIYLSKTLYHIGNDAFANSGYFTNIYFNWDGFDLSILGDISENSLPNLLSIGKIYIPNLSFQYYKNFLDKNKIYKYLADQFVDVDISFFSSDIFISKSLYYDSRVFCSIYKGNEIHINKVDDDLDADNLSIKGTIENNLNKYFITSIDDFSFENCSKITGKIAFPYTIKEIGNFSFFSSVSRTMQISEIDFSNCTNLTEIGISAFQNCQNLSGSINFPKSIKLISSNAFLNAGEFDSIYLNWTPSQLKENFIKIVNENSLPNLSKNGKIFVPQNAKDAYINFFKENNITKYDLSKIIDSPSKKNNLYLYSFSIAVPIEFVILVVCTVLIVRKRKQHLSKK